MVDLSCELRRKTPFCVRKPGISNYKKVNRCFLAKPMKQKILKKIFLFKSIIETKSHQLSASSVHWKYDFKSCKEEGYVLCSRSFL